MNRIYERCYQDYVRVQALINQHDVMGYPDTLNMAGLRLKVSVILLKMTVLRELFKRDFGLPIP